MPYYVFTDDTGETMRRYRYYGLFLELENYLTGNALASFKLLVTTVVCPEYNQLNNYSLLEILKELDRMRKISMDNVEELLNIAENMKDETMKSKIEDYKMSLISRSISDTAVGGTGYTEPTAPTLDEGISEGK